MYIFLYAAQVVASVVLGFMFTSRGSAITERMRVISSIVAHTLLLSIIICAVLEKSIAMAVWGIVNYFCFSNIGQTLTLILMRRKKEIGLLSWVMLVLFLSMIAYTIAFGRVVEI